MRTAKYSKRKVMMDLVGCIMDGDGTTTFVSRYMVYDWNTHEYTAPKERNDDGTPNNDYADYVYAKECVETLESMLDSLI